MWTLLGTNVIPKPAQPGLDFPSCWGLSPAQLGCQAPDTRLPLNPTWGAQYLSLLLAYILREYYLYYGEKKFLR